MGYIVKYRSDKPITPGRCLDCPHHFINLKPIPGEPDTGCELSGEFIPDEWDTEIKPWDKCPVLKVKRQKGKRGKRNGGKREI